MKILYGRRLFCLLFFVLLGLLFWGCKNSEKALDEQGNETVQKSKRFLEESEQFTFGNPFNFERIPVLHTIDPVELKLSKLPFNTAAHRKYLNDPLAFKPIPDGGVPSGPTAVVGSDVCLFYPLNSISTEAELNKLPKGEPIPFAAIIPLGSKLECGDSNKDKMFEFQDNLNFFYKTSWKGKQESFLLISADFSHHGNFEQTKNQDDYSERYLRNAAGTSWNMVTCDNRPGIFVLDSLGKNNLDSVILYRTNSFEITHQWEDDITSYFFVWFADKK